MRYVLSLLLVLLWFVSAQAQLGDVTGTFTFMGNPHLGQWPDEENGVDSQKIYARNIWSMYLAPTQPVIGNPLGEASPPILSQIYMGSGDTLLNSGPVYITYLKVIPPITGCNAITTNCGIFVVTPPAETHQIAQFRELDNVLFFPAIDPMPNPVTAPSGETTLGQYFVLNPYRFWEEHRTIPGAVHVLDLTSIGSPPTKILAAGQMDWDAYHNWRSPMQYTLDGTTWFDVTCGGEACTLPGSNFRFKQFFTLGGEIYVSGVGGLYRFNSSTNDLTKIADATTAFMFPNGANSPWATVNFASGIVYISGIGFPTEASGPKLMYVTASGTTIATPIPITLPYVGAFPRDLRVIGTTLFLLSEKDEGSNVYTVYLHKSTDLNGSGNWTEVLHFQTIPPGGICRAFAFVPTDGVVAIGHTGYLYFGIGTPGTVLNGAYVQTTLSKAAGQIQRIAYTP